ncbi:MAG: uncharacterized protein KVP18_000650 [Porospora cf. gigantea A]|uniref:uncharacterized protein n=1 Tax=Porospora cf. gigantea A TaxID=2853593 RepID=UPI00355A0618|nr:MAG: hypothetical protein KVP18_000650 [Porospora cf. gigantea A]
MTRTHSPAASVLPRQYCSLSRFSESPVSTFSGLASSYGCNYRKYSVMLTHSEQRARTVDRFLTEAALKDRQGSYEVLDDLYGYSESLENPTHILNQPLEEPYDDDSNQSGRIGLHADTKVSLKFLVSHVTAGGIIGKKGLQIDGLQNKFGVRVKITPQHHTFPSTECRICTVSGRFADVIAALTQIIVKDKAGFSQSNPSEISRFPTEIMLVLPNTCAGSVIGKRGGTISKIRDDSLARVILMDPLDSDERLCPISGTVESVVNAVQMILLHMLQDPRYDLSISKGFRKPPSRKRAVCPLLFEDKESTARDVAYMVLSNGSFTDDRITVALNVPPSKCGLVLGRNGARMNFLRSRTKHTDLRLTRGAPRCDGKLSITGPFTDVLYVLAAVTELMSSDVDGD